jgi:phosphomannomutase/phosphoglucomutase
MAHDIGLILAGYLGSPNTIGLAWDTRQSSEMLGFACSAGLMAGGCNVYLFGLVPTPLFSYAIPQLELNGGVMITASHNPPEYNGVKLWASDGASFTPEMELEIENQYLAGMKVNSSWQHCGRLEPADDFRLQYIESLLERIDTQSISQQEFRVAADCGGGTAAMVAPVLLNAVGTENELLFCEPDGLFSNRLPEPKESNLTKLIAIVKENNLDLGMAWDGDADRIIFVTEQGRYLPGDRGFALAAYQTLRDLQEKPKRIVTQVATSNVIYDVAHEVDAEVIEARVGEPYIVSEMKKANAIVGGEENGGVVYRGWSWTREGMLTALKILELLATENKSLGEMDRQFPAYFQVKEGIPCANQQKELLLSKVRDAVPTDVQEKISDGVKLRYSDGWLLLRPSGTESLFRVFAEAKTKTRAQALASQGLKLVKKVHQELEE